MVGGEGSSRIVIYRDEPQEAAVATQPALATLATAVRAAREARVTGHWDTIHP